jgi:hypothetical protein
MKKRNIIFIITVCILALIGLVTLYIYREYNRTHKNTAELDPDYSMDAPGLIIEFESDESKSNNKYWNKVLQVGGFLKEVVKDEKGHYSVSIGDTAASSSVRCSMDSVHNAQAAILKKGNRVVMKGICTGFNRDELLGSDVVLVRCIVEPNK